MATAEETLVLGHRGLLGRALVWAAGGACQVIEAPRADFDLALAPPWPYPFGAGEPIDAREAWESLEALKRQLPALGPGAAAVHARLDMVRRGIVERGPRLVINCIGYTDVDRAEADPAPAFAVNATGAQVVAGACAEIAAQLIHVSTDFVFDGSLRRPYREDDPPRPLSAYARSKLLGEELVRETLPGALIVRTAWLFGPGRETFVDKVLARARSGEPVPVVSDQVGSPTLSRDLARAMLKLAANWVGGVLHLVNSGQASRLEMARRALEIRGLDPELAQPISTAQLGRPAPRPAYGVLDAGRATRLLGGPLPPWQEALTRYLHEIKETSS